jgi:hypothetical protein
MWPILILSLLTLPGQSAAAPQQPNWISAEPIITRQMVFTIPYQIDRPQQISQEPTEVQLFVSTDRGANWRLYGKVEPAQGSFLFRTTTDGEYWFTVRTLDRSGQIRPQWAQAPILRVRIDTNPPALQLKAQRGQAGQITAQWEVRDETFKLDSLRLQYRAQGDQAWQSVAVGPQNFKPNGSGYTGEVTWWPNMTKGTLQIRAECADAASNPAVSHAQVSLDGAADRGSVAQTPATTAKPEPAKPAVAAAKPAAVAAQPNPPIANQAAPPAIASKTPAAPAAATTPAAPPAAAPVAPTAPAATTTTPPVAAAAPAAPAQPAPNAVASSQPAPRPRMINARMFELEYDVSAAGPSGISRVELWATRDGGRTWANVAVDDDNRSPLIVRTDGEGLYGFRVVVRNSNGQGDEPPKSGDVPQVWIGVDLTPPMVRILRVQPVVGQPGQMHIAWEASDALLAERPITLSYSANPNGPWAPIAGGLENTGQYTWTTGPTVPDQILIRVDARDEAGNMAAVQLPGPLQLRRSLPTAQIRDVRPMAPGVGGRATR